MASSVFPMDLNKQAVAAWQSASPRTTSDPPIKRVRRTINPNSPLPPTNAEAGPSSAPVTDGESPAPAPAAEGPQRSSRAVKRHKPNPQTLAEKYRPPELRLAMLGGLETQITQLLEMVALPLQHPEIYKHTGVSRPRGVLLHGVPGGGKTQLVKCLAGVCLLLVCDFCVLIVQELGLPFLSVSAPSIVSGMSGESEKTLRDTFDEAKKVAPCLLFLDEVDAITPKRETAQREMERRIVAQLLTCMDGRSPANAPDAADPRQIFPLLKSPWSS